MPNFKGLAFAFLALLSLPAGLAPSNITVGGCTTPTLVSGGSKLVQSSCGPAIVGGQGTGISTASSLTLDSSAINVSTGNALAVFVGYFAAATTVTATDTAGNTFTGGTSCDEDGNEHGVWLWAANTIANASDVVTAHFATARGHKEITVYQFSGASTSAPKDFNGACAVNGASVPTATSAAFTTTAANEMLLAGVQGGINSNTFTAGPGYTLGAAIGGVAAGRTEFKSVNAIQTGVTASMTFGTNAPFAITILTIKQ